VQAGAVPVSAAGKIDQAIEIIREIGLPRQQQNMRSALTLLALLNLKPECKWKESKKPMIGITPMMGFFARHYGRQYAPNSRETVRRQTIHQFVRHGLVTVNPDRPDRPTNSGKTVYQIDGDALGLIKSFGTGHWRTNLDRYKKKHDIITEEHMTERKGRMIVVKIGGTVLKLSPGGQNVIVKKILEEFAPRFAPDGIPLLVGDTARGSGYFDRDGLNGIGVRIPKHGKIPDVLIHDTKNSWLFVIEAVSSHGPIDAKRHDELRKLFSRSTSGIVYVTAFPDRKSMNRYLETISWETEVWVADSPDHMIHFDGSRFLGPYL